MYLRKNYNSSENHRELQDKMKFVTIKRYNNYSRTTYDKKLTMNDIDRKICEPSLKEE